MYVKDLTPYWERVQRQLSTGVASASVDLHQHLIPGKGVASERLHISLGEGAMREKKIRFSDRRQTCDMPIVPFNDSNGATIWGCRRRVPDRRINKNLSENIDTKWIDTVWNDEIVVS